MKLIPAVPEFLTKKIANCKRAIVCGHLNPDGDCANSVMAMGMLLKALEKDYILVNEGSFSRPEIADFESAVKKEIPENWVCSDTLGIIVDCSTMDRLGKFGETYKKLDVIVIDHHSNGTFSSEGNYIVPKSPSTTLLVYKLFKALNVEISAEAAICLFRGFATDSGYFRFLGENTEECFEFAADLVSRGVVPAHEYGYITGGRPFNSVKFLSSMIDRTEVFFDGKLMISHEKPSDSAKFGDNARASDDLYSQLFTVKGVEAVAFFKVSNKIKGAIEVGLRASHNSLVDVGKIASNHGGGGHIKAAGATIKGSYEEVKSLILSDFEKFFIK